MPGLKVAISADETTAILQADSTTQGALVPRMTTAQRDLIALPATGLLIYNTTTSRHEEYVAGWRAVGTGAVGVSATGEIFLTAAGGWPSTTNGCAAATQNEYGGNDVDLWSLDFDQGSDEYAQWSVWMPDNWDAGTVTAKFAWTAAGGAGNVEWGLQGRSYANDDPIDAAWGAAQTATDTLILADDVHYTAATAAITLAGTPAAGELVQFRAYRNTATGGNLNADAQLLGVKIFYTKS